MSAFSIGMTRRFGTGAKGMAEREELETNILLVLLRIHACFCVWGREWT